MIEVGSIVRHKLHPEFGLGRVVGLDAVIKHWIAVDFENATMAYNDAGGYARPGHGWLTYRENLLPEHPPVPPRSFSYQTQNGKLLRHLLSGRSITPLHARHHYGIESLSRRICDLKAAGHKIRVQYRKDPTGKRYAEYSLRSTR